MTDPNTCRCMGQFAMHKPALHADRDGLEARAQLEREHERALAAYVPEDRAESRQGGSNGNRYGPDGFLCCKHCAEDPIHDVPSDGHDGPCSTCADPGERLRLRAEKAEAALARVEAALDIRSRARAWMHDIGYEDHEIDKAEAWRQPVEPWLQGDPPAAVIDLEAAAGFAREYEEVIRAALRDPYAEAAS